MMKIIILLIVILFLFSCVNKPPLPTICNIYIQSEIPIDVTIYKQKNCEGNWNFCQYQ